MILEVHGAKAHAATGGVELNASDPVLILVHGAGMDSTVWSLQTRYLNHRGIQAVAVDLPGHGQSDGPALHSVAQMADWLVAFCDAAGFESFAVAGHSMGTFIALEVAAKVPKRVRSIALLGTATAMPVHPDLLAAAQSDMPLAAQLMTGWSHANGSRIGLNPTPGLWMTGGAQALIENSAPGLLHADLSACAAYDAAEATARKVTCPVTLILGGQDKMTPIKSGKALTAALQHFTVLELEKSGHMLMVEAPRDVRSALADL